MFYKKIDPFLVDTITIMLKWMMDVDDDDDFGDNKEYINKIINEVAIELTRKNFNHYFDSCGVIEPILVCYEKHRNSGIDLPEIGELDHSIRPRF